MPALKEAPHLKPCPFCGSELKHKTFRIGLADDIWEHPKENDCPLSKTGIGDPLHIFKSDIEAWNKRTPPAQPAQPEQEHVADARACEVLTLGEWVLHPLSMAKESIERGWPLRYLVPAALVAAHGIGENT